MRTNNLFRIAEPYPIAWLQNYGDGRVFYNAMGHREDVWQTQLVCYYLIWTLNVRSKTIVKKWT